MVKKDYLIVGAGITGLCAAYELYKANKDFLLVEREPQVGGNIKSISIDGYNLELGPNSFLETPELAALIEELNLQDQLVSPKPAANSQYIVRNKKPHKVPKDPISAMKTPLFSAGAKWRVLMEPFIAPKQVEGESLADFMERRVGKEVVEYALAPFVSGIYAGDAYKLEAKSSFPNLYRMEAEHGSILKGFIARSKENKKKGIKKKKRRQLVFKNGLQVLPEEIAGKFKQNVLLSAFPKEIKRTPDGLYSVIINHDNQDTEYLVRHLILAIPAPAASTLLKLAFPKISGYLSKIEYGKVIVVHTGFDKTAIANQIEAFGDLIPPKENFNLLGTIWSSAAYENKAPEGKILLTNMVSGKLIDKSPDEIIETVLDELDTLFVVTEPPDMVYVTKYENAIPQYNIGYADIIAHIAQEMPANLYLCGNYIGGIASGECVKNGLKLGKELATR